MRSSTIAALAVAAALASGCARRPAARCHAQAFVATHDGCGIDPRLHGLRDLLTRAPYTAFSCFRATGPAAPPPIALAPGARVVVGDDHGGQWLRMVALSCR